jgi:exodeoxyribonuclease VIII
MVSNSALTELHRSPAHYQAWVEGLNEPVGDAPPALVFGAAFHCGLLEPLTFPELYAIQPDFGDRRFAGPKKEHAAWMSANTGKTIVSLRDAAQIEKMIASVHAHPLASRLVKDGRPELTARWRDDETGLECKVRSDYYVESLGMIVDAKSTFDAGRESFAKSVAKFGYHRQCALYANGFGALGLPVQHFVFLAVEKVPPYAIAVYSLDQDAVARGHAAVRGDMNVLAECMRTGIFPSYPTSIQELSLPPWA